MEGELKYFGNITREEKAELARIVAESLIGDSYVGYVSGLGLETGNLQYVVKGLVRFSECHPNLFGGKPLDEEKAIEDVNECAKSNIRGHAYTLERLCHVEKKR